MTSSCGGGDGAQKGICAQPVCPEPIRCGPLVSSVAAGDLAGFCEVQSQKKQLQEQMKARCRQLGEYDPCQNPCARIPGQHPFCPPGQTIGILPEGYIEDIPRAVAKPFSGPPPRLPWKQCIENDLINDQVRRPMGRWCHVRPLPPIVIPSSEIDRIRRRITERDRIKEECSVAAAERDAARQASYQRHSEWNYTVDSLLARKRQEEEEKAQAEEQEFQQLSKSIKEGRDKYSQEMQERAKQQLLYRKGLIRDFHAAMAYSKALQEMHDPGSKSEFGRSFCQFKESPKGCDGQSQDESLPILNDPCMKRMILENTRPEYPKKHVQVECSEERLQLLKCDESRVPERKAELEKEKEKLKALRTEFPLPWPENYLKHIQEPKCDEKGDEKFKRQQKMKDDILQEIHDKLATDAFIEYHETEIERQACEYNDYKRKVDKMRKEKEKQLIDEKVQRTIKNSEKAAEAWKTSAKGNQQQRTDEYSRLKEIWEAEHAKKENMLKLQRQGLEQRVTQDFICRKDNALVKRLELDATREWEKECCLAVQNYERICEKEITRRDKAKELSKYHLEQVKEKSQREEDERFMNAVYGQKARMNYACEMKEMKDYANAQIQDWKAKGRPIFPLVHAMKKWDYDAGMTPELYSRTPLCGESEGKAPCPEPGFQSTAQRLGFDSTPSQ